MSQPDLEFFTLRELGVERVGVILETIAATLFRFVHCDICGFD